MVTTIIFVIGILFVINGITSMGHTKIVEKTREQMPSGSDIYYGGAKGLLFLSSTDAILAVDLRGKITNAFAIKSGWLRRSKAEELPLSGYSLDNIAKHIEELGQAEQKACLMAQRQYLRRR